MTAHDPALVEKVFDALEAAHDTTWHIHASECCFLPSGSVEAVLDAVADDLREQGRAEVRAAVEAVALPWHNLSVAQAVALRDALDHHTEAGAP